MQLSTDKGPFNKVLDNSHIRNDEPQPILVSIFESHRDSTRQFDFKLCSKDDMPPKKFEFSGTLFGIFKSTSDRSMSIPHLLPRHIAYDSASHRLYLNRNKGYDMCLDINFARLRKIKLTELGGSRYGFALSFKGQQIFLITPSKELQQQWVRTLRRSCILADIERDYSIEEQIGSGGFSSVHIARRKSDGKRFAVKIVDTKLIK